MALEPARVITKVRAPDFLFLHDKDFWFKQIWVDLHQTMVLDRQGSYTRPELGWRAASARMNMDRVEGPAQSNCGYATCISLPQFGWRSPPCRTSDG